MSAAEILWLVAFVVFLAVEAGSVSLVSIWFAVGSLAALIVSWLGGKFWLQIVVFLVFSCALLACLRPVVRKFFSPKIIPTNAESLVGTVGVLTAGVDNLAAQGQIVMNGMEWSARSTSGDPIPAGTTVRVDKIEGVRLFVSPVPEQAKV